MRKLVAKAIRKVLRKITSRRLFFLKKAYANCVSRNFSMSYDQACNLLAKTSPNPSTSSYRKNRLAIEYDLQIIVPCYNVEKYIVKCLDSIVNQKTDYSIDITVVEDGSTDGTRNVLKDYVSKHNGVTNKHINLICQENQGFSGARNAGLETITGRYVMFVDSDDYLAEDAIQALMSTTEQGDYDIVEGSFQTFAGRKSWSVIRDNQIQGDAFDCLYGYPWGKIYKAKLLSDFIFPEDYWYEDTALIYRVWTNTHQIATIKPIVYYYRINEKGISATSTGKPKSIDSAYITGQLLNDLKLHNPELINQQIYNFTIKQSIINNSRTEGLSKEIRYATYIYMRKYINTFFDKTFELPHSTPLEESLRKKADYRLFVAACL